MLHLPFPLMGCGGAVGGAALVGAGAVGAAHDTPGAALIGAGW